LAMVAVIALMNIILNLMIIIIGLWAIIDLVVAILGFGVLSMADLFMAKSFLEYGRLIVVNGFGFGI